jgi:hypothetical protein
MTKPFSNTDLIDKVRTLLSNGQGAASGGGG